MHQTNTVPGKNDSIYFFIYIVNIFTITSPRVVGNDNLVTIIGHFVNFADNRVFIYEVNYNRNTHRVSRINKLLFSILHYWESSEQMLVEVDGDFQTAERDLVSLP